MAGEMYGLEEMYQKRRLKNIKKKERKYKERERD